MLPPHLRKELQRFFCLISRRAGQRFQYEFMLEKRTFAFIAVMMRSAFKAGAFDRIGRTLASYDPNTKLYKLVVTGVTKKVHYRTRL